MHFNFDFTALQVLWALTFASLLVLLVVLLGRDRMRFFPWFTASIVLTALRLLTSRLLFGKLPPILLNEIFITIGLLLALLGLLVVVEMARRAFKGLGRAQWIANAAGALLVAGFVVAFWGPWPAWKTIKVDSLMAGLRLMQLIAQKLDLLVNVLTVEVGLLVVLFGRRYAASWRSHTQRILIGLSTVAIGQMAVQGVWQLIAMKAVPTTQAEYERLLALRDNVFNSVGVVYIVVIVWWIVCLWIDEPGTEGAADTPAEDAESQA